MGLQTALRMVYPPSCLACGGMVESEYGICGQCWGKTPFISGTVCDGCGVPLEGEAEDAVFCDDCQTQNRPWVQGRAALLYQDNGRKLVLALKHGDRHDIVKPAGIWLARAARPMLGDDTLIAPIPLHWLRMLKRKFNQSALLAQSLAEEVSLPHCPDLLQRPRRTRSLEGLDREERFETLKEAITVNPRRRHRLIGRRVLLVDDVMTSGATLEAATEACLQAGAGSVSVVTLARVAKRP